MDSEVYNLTASLKGHEDDVRGVLFPEPTSVISVSRDATVRLWTRFSDNVTEFEQHVNSTGAAFINAVAFVSPNAKYPNGLIISGGSETIIDAREPRTVNQDAEFMLLGHTHNVCALDSLHGIVVSGSWDGTARVWVDWETKHVLEGHEGAVWAVLVLSETEIVTGGADKTIRLWKEGMHTLTMHGHSDCVRGLCRLPNGLFASCGNDATIRIWSINGQEIQKMYGHTNYIYSIDATSSGEIISSGEDRTVRIWKDGICIQTITHPAISIWSVAICQHTGDIVTGASDKYVRIFSRNKARWASQETLNEFSQSVAASSIPFNQVGEINRENLPGLEILQVPGKKDGQVVVVRNGDTVEAHTWSTSTSAWTNVGTVVDTAASGTKKILGGVEYDYVFDVDIKEGSPPLKLPYNLSENPFEVARKFLEKNELPIDYLDTVGNWIAQNSKGVSLSGNESDLIGTDSVGTKARHTPGDESEKKSESSTKYIPHKQFLSITTANLEVVQRKIVEINQNLLNTGQKDISLNPGQLSAISELSNFLQPPSSLRRNHNIPHTVIAVGLEVLIQMISVWPISDRLPALDLLRLLVAASPQPALYKFNEKDLVDVLGDSGSVSPHHINNAMLTVRTFVNMFQHPSGRELMVSKAEEVLELVTCVSATSTGNRNFKIAEATLLLNFAAIFFQTGDSGKAVAILEHVSDFVNSEAEPEASFRILVCLGTLLSIGNVRDAAGLFHIQKAVENIAERVHDPRIQELYKDIQDLL